MPLPGWLSTVRSPPAARSNSRTCQVLIAVPSYGGVVRLEQLVTDEFRALPAGAVVRDVDEERASPASASGSAPAMPTGGLIGAVLLAPCRVPARP